jgi:hypothetical protein
MSRGGDFYRRRAAAAAPTMTILKRFPKQSPRDSRRGGCATDAVEDHVCAAVDTVMRLVERSGLRSIIGVGTLQIDRPDLKGQSTIEARVATGDLRRFIKAAGQDEPIPSNHFL